MVLNYSEYILKYIKNAKKNPNNPEGAIDYAFYRRLDTTQQLIRLEHKRLDELKSEGIFPRFPITDADSLPFYVKGRDMPLGYVSRYYSSQNLDGLVGFHN